MLILTKKRDKYNVLYMLIIVIVIMYVNASNVVQRQTKFNRYNIYFLNYAILFFSLVYLYLASNVGYKEALYAVLFIWAFMAGMTPTPEASFLLSVPLKFLYNVTLFQSQLIICLFSWAIVYYFHAFHRLWLNNYYFGRLANKILAGKHHYIIAICFINTLLLSYMLDRVIDFSYGKLPLYYFTKPRNLTIASALIAITMYGVYIYTKQTNKLMPKFA